MAGLKLKHIYKVYPNGLKAVTDFNMEIEDKEFIVFVGPSGCGKSTTLRMIAGLEEISAGELYIGDVPVNSVEPKDRDIAMVFQNYALYPHMTVYDNIAFGLKLRKIPDEAPADTVGLKGKVNAVLRALHIKKGEPSGKMVKVMRHLTKEEIDEKVNEAAGILGITEYLKKKPKEMSGGQRQRVALGRAIVRKPKVFLLDEPLSNLDAKLRTQMRSEISKLHQKLQTTFIYVTHDQVEAMTMGTRIVVMKDGVVQQIDTPRNLYNHPVNKFVAGFIGTPQMNFFKGTLEANGEHTVIRFENTAVEISAPARSFAKVDKKYLDGKKPIFFGIRCEHISTDPERYPYKAKCRVSYVEELGVDAQVYADFNLSGGETITESPTRVVIKAPAGTDFSVGQEIEVSLDLLHLHLFDAENERTILPFVPEQTVFACEVKGGKATLLGNTISLPAAVCLNDGTYELKVPTRALHFGGDIPVRYVGEEELNGQKLIEVEAGDNFFVLDDGGDKGGVSIDWKACSFLSDGKELLSALPSENCLEGKIVKEKKEGEKKPVYTLVIAETPLTLPAPLAEKIIESGGKDLFKNTLEICFAPVDAAIGQEGIPATVEKILDYGTAKYALCRVGDTAVYIETKEDRPKEVKIAPDLSKISVKDKTFGIRLI